MQEFKKLIESTPGGDEFGVIQRKFDKQCSKYAQTLSDPATCKALGIKKLELMLTLIQKFKLKFSTFENFIKTAKKDVKALQITAPAAVN